MMTGTRGCTLQLPGELNVWPGNAVSPQQLSIMRRVVVMTISGKLLLNLKSEHLKKVWLLWNSNMHKHSQRLLYYDIHNIRNGVYYFYQERGVVGPPQWLMFHGSLGVPVNFGLYVPGQARAIRRPRMGTCGLASLDRYVRFGVPGWARAVQRPWIGTCDSEFLDADVRFYILLASDHADTGMIKTGTRPFANRSYKTRILFHI